MCHGGAAPTMGGMSTTPLRPHTTTAFYVQLLAEQDLLRLDT
jgi:hypothetical protein